jgi:hypothetical protein
MLLHLLDRYFRLSDLCQYSLQPGDLHRRLRSGGSSVRLGNIFRLLRLTESSLSKFDLLCI